MKKQTEQNSEFHLQIDSGEWTFGCWNPEFRACALITEEVCSKTLKASVHLNFYI